MKTIIAGGREFYNFLLMKSSIDPEGVSEVVCGGARGADQLGRRWAEAFGVPVKMFPANWDKHGKAAGPIRNKEMGDYADQLIAFWDGESRGTAHMIKYMESLGKPVKVIRY